MATKLIKWIWLIYAGDDRSNELLGKMLGDENAYTEQECEDGVKRGLWCCPNYEFVDRFVRTANHNRLPHKVFVRKGRAKIRLWSFGHHAKDQPKKGVHHEQSRRLQVH
ncbi:MAG: hypothetical protein WCV82_03720 [Candidatus Paceibacterota bacterium]